MSVRQRGAKWQARVTVAGQTVTKTFTQRADAEKWSRHQQVALERGEYQPPQAIVTLRELIERYERECLPSKRGQAQERYVLERWKRSSLAGKTLASVKPADIARARDERLKEVSPTSVRRYLDTLSAVFEVARKDWELTTTNPVRSIRKPPPGRARERRVSPDEIDRIINATQSKDLPAVVVLAVETAMRRAEILGLEWSNVDLDRRIAYLPLTKNGDSRAVPLTIRAVDVLKAIPKRPDGKVFKHNGTSLSEAFRRAAARARQAYERERQQAGATPQEIAEDDCLRDVRLHDCRHERVSTLVEAGFGLMEVAAISGHKTLQCLKRYTHVRTEHLISKLDAIRA